eukprot:5201687-Prymnesium_polylepis.1
MNAEASPRIRGTWPGPTCAFSDPALMLSASILLVAALHQPARLACRPSGASPAVHRHHFARCRVPQAVASTTEFIKPLDEVSSLPPAVAGADDGSRPLLLFLPGIDGTGLAGSAA